MILAERGYLVSGVDYSETAVQLAERNAQQAGLAIRFSVGDCLHLDDFESESMDLIVDNHVLHCVIGAQDRLAFLRSAYRILKPGGTLFSETMSCEGNYDAANMGADPATRISTKHTRYWVRQGELNEEMAAAGFRILHQELRPKEDEPGVGADIITYARRPVSGEQS